MARLVGIDTASALERLTADGVIARATAPRPVATGTRRPSPRRPLSERVGEHRRAAVSIVYFDASALVKLVVAEDGSDLAATLWDGCDAAVASRLAYPEVRAALAAAGRNHDLSASELSDATRIWDA